MCRILAQLSAKPQTAEPHLTQAPWSLLAQSQAKQNRLQEDGWGIAWYAREKPQCVRSTSALFRQARRFSQAARQAVSHCLIAHARAASNPRGLPKERLLRLENTQPFVQREWIFAHNGTLHLPQEVLSKLGGKALRLQGENDSEVLFQLFLRMAARSYGGGVYAVHQMVESLQQIWRVRGQHYPRLHWIATGVNFVATDGRVLLVFCYWHPKAIDLLESRSLGLGTQAFFQMSYQFQKGRLVIASEPTDQSAWHWIPQGHLLVAKIHRGSLDYHIEKIIT